MVDENESLCIYMVGTDYTELIRKDIEKIN